MLAIALRSYHDQPDWCFYARYFLIPRHSRDGFRYDSSDYVDDHRYGYALSIVPNELGTVVLTAQIQLHVPGHLVRS